MAGQKKHALFICYSHTDADYKLRFDKFLKGGALRDTLDIFSDADIQPGEDWLQRIMEALRRATAALILVSQDFMISPFIQQVELRALLTSELRRGLRLFLVPVRATYYQGTYLERFQWARAPEKPLSLLVESEQEQAMVDVCKLIASAVNTPPDQPTIDRTIAGLESIPRLDLPAIYEIHGIAGAGAFARCYYARDRLLQRQVIIKVLNEELSRDSPAYDRYVGSVAVLNHHNILGVLFSQTNKLPHFIVTLRLGDTLEECMRAKNPARRPTLDVTVKWIIELAETLHYAHRRGCVHGRLRPSEVRLDGNDLPLEMRHPVLSGLRTLSSTAPTPFSGEDPKISLEDFRYASPEMRRDGKYSEKSDQYLLGLLAYELLGSGVFAKRQKESNRCTWGSLLHDDFATTLKNPTPLYEIAPQCGERVSAVIMKALSEDPADRWTDLEEFRRELEAARTAQSVHERAKESYRRYAQKAEFYEAVYDELFRIMPAARAMFRHASLKRQYKVVQEAIWLLLKYPSAPDAQEPSILGPIARTHAGRTAAEYDLFRDAILAAVAKNETPEGVEAWRAAMEPGFRYLKQQLPKQAEATGAVATPGTHGNTKSPRARARSTR